MGYIVMLLLNPCLKCGKQPQSVLVELDFGFAGELFACVDCGIVAHGGDARHYRDEALACNADSWNQRRWIKPSEIKTILGYPPGKYKKQGLGAFIDLQERISNV